jgi:hypothetical protein
MFGGPLVKDRTFIFVDYQGQRQRIGRTVTSNVPTLAERSGVFRQNIYDPATTAGNTRQQFPNNTIPRSAMDPVALSLLDRYPLPTSTATANNYSRTANEVDDQDSGRCADRSPVGDRPGSVFGRLTHFRGHAEPVTAFPDGSGTIPAGSVAVGPQGHGVVGVRIELSAHLLAQPAERAAPGGHTARRPAERGIAVFIRGKARSTFPASPSSCAIPQHDADLRPQRPTSSSDPEQHGPRTSAPASRRSLMR